MKLIRNSNLSIIAYWTLFGLFAAVGILLMQSSIFKWNIPVMIAYIALVSILLGKTPTNRWILTHFYSIVRNKRKQSLITDDLTVNSVRDAGLNLSEVTIDVEGRVRLPIVMARSKIDGLFYIPLAVSGKVTGWTDDAGIHDELVNLKTVLNLLDGNEKFFPVMSKEVDSGMADLANELTTRESVSPTIDALTVQRIGALAIAGSESQRNLQQYVIFALKRNHISVVLNQLIRHFNVSVPDYPVDILLSGLGFEGGLYADIVARNRALSQQVVEKRQSAKRPKASMKTDDVVASPKKKKKRPSKNAVPAKKKVSKKPSKSNKKKRRTT